MRRYRNFIWILIVLTILVSFLGFEQIELLVLNYFITTSKISIQDDNMYLIGSFNSKSYEQVKEAIEANPQIETIVLTANAGSSDDETTLKLARYIRNQELNTHLLNQSVIASGAVDLFLSGKRRTIEKGATLGVHSWSYGPIQAKDLSRNDPKHQPYTKYMKDMIGSDEFYWFTIYAAPADSIYWMKKSEIQKFKLTTSEFLNPSHDKTPFGEEFQSERKNILENS